jgi:Mg/Co/Ni transporter MgtE
MAVTACGGGDSTAAFCEGWQASLDQLDVVAGLDEEDPAYLIELQRLQDLNATVYDLAPVEIREAAQQLADLTARRTPQELAELSEQTEELTNTILNYVERTCPG